MKHFYTLVLAVTLFLSGHSASAAEWSFDWPEKPSASNPDVAYFNFSSNYDADLTTQERTFNGVSWTATFDAGTKLTSTSASGQAIGSLNAFTNAFNMASDGFDGKITAVKVQTRTKLADATLAVTVGGSAYKCGDSENAAITTAETTAPEYIFLPSETPAEGQLNIHWNLPASDKVTYIRAITVVYEEGSSTVEKPVFTPAPGSYDEALDVAISAPAGAEIYYTTDGSNPRMGGTLYSSPIHVGASCTVKAVAKLGPDFSAVAEARYVVRVSPGLSFTKEALTIELLEEDLALINNPYRVEPVTYSSSNNSIAYCDRYGHIYTYSVGECVIRASFAGNTDYLPQTIELPVTVVAKEPLAGLTVTPASGTYNDAVDVAITCSDERAKAIWYHIGDAPMTLDDLGILDDFEIHPSTSLSLNIDHSCVLSVQAMGENVWSEPQFISYTVNMPLRADFRGPQAFTTIYRNGFDSTEEANEWKFSQGSSWGLVSNSSFNGVPDFSAINPESKYSLFHRYANTGDASVITSPDIVVPADAMVRFYALFNPVWIYDGNLELYVCENVDGAQPVKIWDAFLASQQAATDDIKWTQYSADLSKYAGKEVYFAYVYYLTNGDNVLIDDFEVVAPDGDGSTVTLSVGETARFTDLSTGAPETYLWSFPGADSESSTERNPDVVYSKPGTYTVSLTVGRGSETATATRENYVVVKAQAPTAAISVSPAPYYSPEASIVVPLGTEITYSDASTGAPTAYSWTLTGADVENSTASSVTVKYAAEGMYDVDLTVSNEAGSSSAYITGIKAGGKTPVWNISAAENANLAPVDLSWYGYYCGTNWLGMEAFAERFEAPMAEATISAVNVYFAVADVASPDAPVKVEICAQGADGMPGDVLASAAMPASQLVDASQTYNDPTVFVLNKAVKLDAPFFVVISGFPCDSEETSVNNLAVYALRRGEGARNTAFHLLRETDDSYQYTGEKKWYAQTDEPTSLAIAPVVEFAAPASGIQDIEADEAATDAEATYYTIQGIRVAAENLAPGIYIRVVAGRAEKIAVR